VPPIRLVVASAEEAADGHAEFWCGPELMAVTVLHEGRLQLRLESRADGEPWLIDTETLALALEEAAKQIAKY
jgi:hypothetical protein